MRMDTLALRPSGPAPAHLHRRRTRRLVAPLAVLLGAMIALIAPQTCAACSCIVMTFSEAADQAEVIFVGTVTGREDGKETEFGPGIDYTFAVSEVYKGSAPAEAVVRTADNSAACGFNFDEGETYLVMASSSAAGLETNLCTGTVLAADVADEDLESLGPPSGPTAASPSSADPAAGASGPGRVWVIAGGATLGALLAGLLVWWQRRRSTDDSAGPETRRASPGEALPHTEAT